MKKRNLTQLFEARVNQRAIKKEILDIILSGDAEEALDAFIENPGNLSSEEIAYMFIETAMVEFGILSEVKKKAKAARKKIEKFEKS